MSDLELLRVERDRYKDALETIASGKRDEVLGITEAPPRASRRYMMRVARAALQVRRKGDLSQKEWTP